MEALLVKLEPIFDFMINQWLFDISVFSNPWLYIPLLIPFFIYLIFFFCKWSILTAPLWIPFSCILKVFKRDDSCSCNTDKYVKVQKDSE